MTKKNDFGKHPLSRDATRLKNLSTKIAKHANKAPAIRDFTRAAKMVITAHRLLYSAICKDMPNILENPDYYAPKPEPEPMAKSAPEPTPEPSTKEKLKSLINQIGPTPPKTPEDQWEK